MRKEHLENISKDEAVQVPLCINKAVVEECLFQTGSICENCDGYDFKCQEYKIKNGN